VTRRRAVFLDRDGTLVRDPGFLKNPADVALLPEAGAALGRLSHAGYTLVVVTNQSGIGRGLMSEQEYAAVRDRVEALLAAEGAPVAATYHCPHSPEDDDPCACRKPGTKLYRRAMADLGIDPERSWWVGDRMSDLQPAAILGGRAVLVTTGHGRDHVPIARERGIPTVPGIGEAATHILSALADAGD